MGLGSCVYGGCFIRVVYYVLLNVGRRCRFCPLLRPPAEKDTVQCCSELDMLLGQQVRCNRCCFCLWDLLLVVHRLPSLTGARGGAALCSAAEPL